MEYTIPEFLKNQSVDEIHQNMLGNLPDDIDKSQGQFPWDFTRCTAIEKSRMIEFQLNETIKLIYPMFAYGTWLDKHAGLRGLTRKDANRATTTLLVTGIPGTVIPDGLKFSTPSTNQAAGVEFQSTQYYTVPESGSLEIFVEAVQGGIAGNVAKGTIKLMTSPIEGILSITNPAAATGGTEIEDDESLRERILESDSSDESSFVGNDSDYVRWARQVPGVGQAIVVPEWNGAGTVKIICVDSQGQPANQQIRDDVYELIVSPSDRSKRLAPIGATVTVTAPTTIDISVSASIELSKGQTKEVVSDRFKTALQRYYLTAIENLEIRHTQVGALLIGTEGVADYENLLINGSASNIQVSAEEYPVTAEVVFHVI